MYRIQKYWLKGDKAGTSEIFVENLPGFPDNVSSNEEGIFGLHYLIQEMTLLKSHLINHF